jgi:DHA2 family multidrug resistance protein
VVAGNHDGDVSARGATARDGDVGVGMMCAPILGPTLGGWITDNWNWRWNFYINVPIGAIALVMVFTFVHDPPFLGERRGGGRIDYLGIAYLVIWLGLLQIVVDRGQRADWFSSAWVVWPTVCSWVAMVLLIVREQRISEPILELHSFKIPQFASALFAVVVLSFVLFGSGLLNPIFLQEFMGYTLEGGNGDGAARDGRDDGDVPDGTDLARRIRHQAFLSALVSP